MGHPPSDERLEFTNLEVSCGNGRFWHICKHCDRAYEASKQPTGTYALSEPKKMKGRIEAFKSHVKHCPHFIAYIKARANANPLPGDDSARSTSNGSRFHADDVLSQVNPKRQKIIDEYFVGISEEEERNQLNRHLLEFHSNLPESYVELKTLSRNLPESYVGLKTLSRLLEFAQKMKAAVLPLPPRKTFGGGYTR
ncbi:hypothetical protein PR001_g22136 [Phytophthora rubi]|uniref:Uncharacterized protein n=1 Tax=Phytophthora rubi TaxID=129364 RepID=A0A6A3J120_9STRA|nr:hypothetical protein PR001_g22136 [Phytophthora rubi]